MFQTVQPSTNIVPHHGPFVNHDARLSLLLSHLNTAYADLSAQVDYLLEYAENARTADQREAARKRARELNRRACRVHNRLMKAQGKAILFAGVN